MSNQDSFLNEVTEEVRKDRLYKLFRKYGWIAAVLIVAIVAGTSWFEWQKAQAAAEAEATGDAILTALSDDDAGALSQTLASLDTGDNAARSAVLAFLKADADLDGGDRDGALAGLLAIADSPDTPNAYKDLATVKWALTGAGSLDIDERVSRLNSIAVGTSAFRLLAMEQIAIAEIERGNADVALGTLNDIANDAGVSQDLLVRAQRLIVALGGDLGEG